MPQTTYNLKPALAYLGMPADVGMDNIPVSRAAGGNVHVGSLVVAGTDSVSAPGPGQCIEIPDGAGAIPGGIVGIAIYDSSRPAYTADANGKAIYVATEMVPIQTRGRVWVWTEAATAQTDAVFVRVLAAGADAKGQFRPGAAANFIAWTAARFVTATAGAGLIQLEIR